jgi:DNA mismatch repair protein MutL
MTSRIHRLDSLTIDKIAAGEVIESSASCIKELIDNSLDAGATDILIEVRLGGRELIRITDNGCGMCREDVVACIERHSTSKLSKVEDLETIVSRGFRGEALASIAAISKLKITSAESLHSSTLQPATTLVMEGGTITTVTDTQALAGTQVEITSLFYNVPARRKFLKSPSKETPDIVKTVTALALASPHVSFRLIIDGKQVLAVAEENKHQMLGRIKALLGDPFRHDSFEVFLTKQDFSLSGLIVNPLHARSTRSGQYLIVNNRPIHSLPISYAVKAAYGTALDSTKHPLFVLHMSLDPASIDINVHPQKKEVRFADEEWVKLLVQEAVSDALFGQKPISSLEEKPLPIMQAREHIALWKPLEVAKAPATYTASKLELVEQKPDASCLAVIGDVALFRLSGTLPAPLSQNGILLLDIRQAMRIAILRELESTHEGTLSEPLLVPIHVSCSLQEEEVLLDRLPQLERIGFVVRHFGPHSFLIDGIPSYAPDIDAHKFLLDAASESYLFDGLKQESLKKLATLYVASMKSLRPPVTHESALAVFRRWATLGFPALSPDGSFCYSELTDQQLKECIHKRNAKGSDHA